MPETTNLTALTTREAIADALYRTLRGLDLNDRALFASGLVNDASLEVTAGPATLRGWDDFCAFSNCAFKLITSHVISGVRINVEEGADTAHMTASAMGYHVRNEEALTPKDASYTSSCVYDIQAVKGGDGLWRMQRWNMRILWTCGEASVLHGEDL